MSWGYRSYDSKFYFSEKEIDFTSEYLDYGQFLLQEFFTADLETRKKLSNYYSTVYGARSFSYLKRKYSEWANGDYHLTDLMRDRILAVMAKFLNDTAKHKLALHEFMASIKNTIKTFEKDQIKEYIKPQTVTKIDGITLIFDKEYSKIKNLAITKFRFNILTEDEKFEALEICKFILEVKLQNTFDQIERDVNVFLPELFKNWPGDVSATYFVSQFNTKLVIDDFSFSSLQMPKFKIYQVELNGRFKDIVNKYLAYEILTLNNDSKIGTADSQISLVDVGLFFKEYDKLLKLDGEVKIDSTFQGQGGSLVLGAYFKPRSFYISEIAIAGFKLLGYATIICVIVMASLKFNIFGILLIFAIPLTIYLGALILADYEKFATGIKDLNKARIKKK